MRPPSLDRDSTVEQEIFVCRKFSQISQDSWNFPAREYYHFTVWESSGPQLYENSQTFPACELPMAQICENFLLYSTYGRIFVYRAF